MTNKIFVLLEIEKNKREFTPDKVVILLQQMLDSLDTLTVKSITATNNNDFVRVSEDTDIVSLFLAIENLKKYLEGCEYA